MNGVFPEFRALLWQLLLGYLNPQHGLREKSLSLHRKKYGRWVGEYFRPNVVLSDTQRKTLQQITVDVPRTNCKDAPAFFGNKRMAESLTRVLFIWSLVFEKVGYFQGLNELAIPLYVVFFKSFFMNENDGEEADIVINKMEESSLQSLEGDVFWCLVRMLDPVIRSTNAQGSQIHALEFVAIEEKLIAEMDPELFEHFKELNIDFMFFAFRWNVCFLLRDFPLELVFIIWDYYLLECPDESGFAEFHPFVCISLLQRFRKELMECQDSTEMLIFLQNFPTQKWEERDVRDLIIQSVLNRNKYVGHIKHLQENLKKNPPLDMMKLRSLEVNEEDFFLI